MKRWLKIGAALMLHAKVGARIARGAPLCTIESDEPARARAVQPLVRGAFVVGNRPPTTRPLVLETLGGTR